MCRDPLLAEDLAQDTFLRAWKAIDTMPDKKAAKAWLINILRRENAHRFERMQLDLIDPDTYFQSDPDALHSKQETGNEWLSRYIAHLPTEYQELLLLQVLCGFSCEEISGLLGLTKNTVMKQLFRVRKQLNEILVSVPQQGG